MFTKEQLEQNLAKCDNWQPRNKQIKRGNNFLAWVNDDGTFEATSYGWWDIVHFKNGLYFFNDYSYSVQTRKHQQLTETILKTLGIECIYVKYAGSRYNQSGTLQETSIEKILTDKIESLYEGENTLALSRATKYSVYSEEEFNQTMQDIQKIAKAMKLSNKQLNKMLIDAETKATEEIMTKLCNDHTRRTTIREMRKANNDLSAIQL